MTTEINWHDGLEQLFAATLNQEPLEDASQLMASISSHDQEYHKECLFLFEKAKGLAQDRNKLIIGYINKSGYKVVSYEEALHLIMDFEAEYMRAFSEYN